MRIAEDKNEDLIGKVAVCSTGRLAVITHRTSITVDNPDFDFENNYDVDVDAETEIEGWAGLGLDGAGTWFSTKPCILAESGQEFHDKLRERFDGALGYNL